MRKFCLPVFALTALAMIVSHNPVHAQGVLEACEGDVAEFCSRVEPGNGRIIACMYAHEDKISESCDRAIDDFADIIDTVFAEIQNALALCAQDIETTCAGTEFGEGRVLSCLIKNASDVQPGCREMILGYEDGVTD